MMDYPKFTKMFQGKNAFIGESDNWGQNNQCSRCQCYYNKQNHRRLGVPR